MIQQSRTTRSLRNNSCTSVLSVSFTHPFVSVDDVCVCEREGTKKRGKKSSRSNRVERSRCVGGAYQLHPTTCIFCFSSSFLCFVHSRPPFYDVGHVIFISKKKKMIRVQRRQNSNILNLAPDWKIRKTKPDQF